MAVNGYDETYWPPTPIMEGVTVLATSVEDKANKRSTPTAAQPMFWTYELGTRYCPDCSRVTLAQYGQTTSSPTP